ncbi:MAG: hypothetical protein AAFN17_05890, partial [Pseudomonadota bacterium]
DDRMISILSGIVLMLAVGTLVQRQDMVSELLGGDGSPNVIALRPDAISVAPDTLTRIDVLANDENLTVADYARLEVLSQPNCGRVFVQGEALQFLAEVDCEATQTFTYTLTGLDADERVGEVTVNVRGATGTRNAPEPQVNDQVALLDPSAAPRPVTTPTAEIADAPADDGATLPRIVVPSAPTPSAASTPSIPLTSAAPQPSAPRPSQPSVAGISNPVAPGGVGAAPVAPGAGTAPGRSPGQAIGGSGFDSSGISIAAAPSSPRPSAPSGSIPRPTIAGPSAPTAPPGLGVALGTPAAPSLGGGFAPAAPSAPGAPGGGALGAPTRPATGQPSQPQAGGLQIAGSGAEPQAPQSPSTPPLGLQIPQPGAARVARIDGSSSTVVGAGAGQPSGIERSATPTLALARVEVPTQAAAPRPSTGGGDNLALAGPSIDARSGADVTGNAGSAGSAVAFAEPSAGLGDIINMRDMMSAVPLLDTTGPAALTTPPRGGEDEEVRIGALTPGTTTLAPDATVPGIIEDNARPEAGATPEAFDVARLPTADLACVVPPSVTMDVRAAAETDLIITSPCHADSVAEVTYADMTFGVAVDRAGRGMLTMYGFEPSSDARLEFEDGESVEFSVPFTGVERVERVAVAWNDPVSLNLHALEFGAEQGSDGHVRLEAPRDFRSVRRRGGGYLASFGPVDGVGQSVQIYSHWIRRGGKAGVVQMYLDYASRDVRGEDGTCGTGDYARPSFKVIRSSRGRVEDPNVRRLAAVDCDDVATGESVLIGAAVRDIIISQR